MPPTAMVLAGVGSVQLGSALAKGLFGVVGPGGAALLRVGVAAVVLLVVARPRLEGRTRSDLAVAVLFGLVTAAMNLSFYLALDRVPLGIAVALEFSGPLTVAVLGSRRAVDLVWAVLAAAGIALLAPWGGLHLDVAGVLFALLAGSCWALYIVLSQRVGGLFPGGSGLAIAMTAGGIALVPVGVAAAGVHLLQPRWVAVGAAVALLSSVIPYSLELEALRHLPARVFGVLMAIEPAVAALFGFLLLHQVLSLRTSVAILLVIGATVGVSLEGRTSAPQPG